MMRQCKLFTIGTVWIASFLLTASAEAFMLSFGSAGATTGDQKVFINQLIDEFRKAHPDAQVEIRDSTSYVRPIVETLMADVGESAPDLAVVGLVEWPVLHKKSRLNPYSEILSDAELKKIWKSFNPALTGQVYGKTVEVQRYSLPFNRAVPVLFVNSRLLPELAVERPISWNQLVALLAQRQKSKPDEAHRYKVSVPTDDWISEAILLNARASATLKGTTARLSNPKSVEILKDLRQYQQLKVIDLVQAQNTAYFDFIEGRSAAALISISTFKSIESRVAFPFKVVMPPDAGTRLTVLGGGDLVLPRGAGASLDEKKKRDLKNFLLWFYLGKGSQRWAEITGFLHTRKGSGGSAVYEKAKWKIGSFYELDEFCNIIFLRDGVQKAIREATSNDDPSAVLAQADRYLAEVFRKPCP